MKDDLHPPEDRRKRTLFCGQYPGQNSAIPVTFRVKNKIIRKWDPFTGKISGVSCFSVNKDGICLPLNMAPYERFFLSSHPANLPSVAHTDFGQINAIHGGSVEAESTANGHFMTTVHSSEKAKSYASEVVGLPLLSSFQAAGKWS